MKFGKRWDGLYDNYRSWREFMYDSNRLKIDIEDLEHWGGNFLDLESDEIGHVLINQDLRGLHKFIELRQSNVVARIAVVIDQLESWMLKGNSESLLTFVVLPCVICISMKWSMMFFGRTM